MALLSNLVDINPESITKKYPFDEIEYIDITSVHTGSYDGTRSLKLKDAPSRAKRIVKDGDTILATVRPNLRAFLYIKNPADNAVASTGFAVLRAKKEKLNSRYLYYVVTNQYFTDYLTLNAKGSAYPAVDAGIIGRADIYLPELALQPKIAHVLSAYDDLIENNSKRIEKLEAMARLLYRHYFEVSEASDWEEKPIKDFLTNHIGGGWGSDKQDQDFSEPAFVIRGTDIPPGRSGDTSGVPFRYHKSSNLRSRALKAGDIIFEVSGGSKGQPLGRSMLVTKELLNRFSNPVMCASFCKRISTNPEILFPEILYLSFLNAYENGEIETYSVQSTGISNFKWTEYIERVSRKVPPYALQLEFKDKVAPVFSQIAILGKKNSVLRQTRDLLLPRLMSGEIEV